jgi:hypothetical protein
LLSIAHLRHDLRESCVSDSSGTIKRRTPLSEELHPTVEKQGDIVVPTEFSRWRMIYTSLAGFSSAII